MIPVLIVLGLTLGRWWRSCLVLAAVAWPALLVATDVMAIEPDLLVASALAVANVAVGVIVNRAGVKASRSVRSAFGTA